MPSFIKSRSSLKSGFFLFFIGFASAYLFFYFGASGHKAGTADAKANGSFSDADCDITSFRRGGYDHTKPLLYVERSCESPDFLPLKNAINEQIRAFKASEGLATASVYVRDFEHSQWMGIQESDGYHPGSLLKVPLMLTYLNKVEQEPGLMDKQYLFEPPPPGTLPVQNYRAPSIEAGKKYSVRDLLRYMIVHSDNNATWLLNQKMGLSAYEKTFLDLGVNIPLPDAKDSLLRISARDYSVFFRAMYNSSYLSPDYSEYALSLLSETGFSEGFVKGIPQGTKLVHKFGEWDNGQEFELHESGIFYVKGKGYLVTIMTQGKDRAKLPQVVSSLTQTIYRFVAEP